MSTLTHGRPARPATAVFIEPWARSVYKGQTSLELTRREFDLLLFLAEHPRHVFTRAQLLTHVWGDFYAGGRTVDVHVRRLRAKIGADLVTTVRGIGYRLADRADVYVDVVPDFDGDALGPWRSFAP
jgi:DNA-binding response OmpR family regulator